jgi:hypothetical protein
MLCVPAKGFRNPHLGPQTHLRQGVLQIVDLLAQILAGFWHNTMFRVFPNDTKAMLPKNNGFDQ